MRRPIAVAAAAGALAVAGTAMAASGSGPIGTLFRADHADQQAQFSKDLASKLGNGVTADQVSKALDQVHQDRESRERADLAKGLASKLNVSQSNVESALQKAENQARRGFQRGQPPRDDFAATLAKDLGKSESDVRKAFRAVQQDRLNARLDQLVKDGRLSQSQADQIKKRLKNGPPGFGVRRGPHGPGGPGHGGFIGPGPGPGGPEGSPPPGM
jgi:AraC-like DNA-binding protein